jgi:hypothetical protein
MSSTITLLLACILPILGLGLLVGGLVFLKSESGRPNLKVSDWIHHEEQAESELRNLRIEETPQDS